MALPQPGERLAQYELLAIIARGGMGTVFRARDERLDREVALKLLSPELSDDPMFRARFEREYRIAAAIRHPNIIPIFDAGQWQEQLYIAMLLVEGRDLATILEQDGPLEPGRVASIVSQVAAALDAAAAAGIVHRDVKPSNILLVEHGGAGGSDHAYLADFGLTRRASSASQMTRAGVYLGTLGYIAPEQLQGGAIDARVDQYSLACVAVELLSGAPPYPRESEIAMITAHLTAPSPVVSQRRPELPPALDQVVARGMAKEPDERYASAGEFAAAFAAALSGQAAANPEASIGTLSAPTVALGQLPPRVSPTPARNATPATLAAAPIANATASGRRRTGQRTAIAGAITILLAIALAFGFAIGWKWPPGLASASGPIAENASGVPSSAPSSTGEAASRPTTPPASAMLGATATGTPSATLVPTMSATPPTMSATPPPMTFTPEPTLSASPIAGLTITTNEPYAGTPGAGAIRVQISGPYGPVGGLWASAYQQVANAVGQPVAGNKIGDAYVDDTGTGQAEIPPGIYVVSFDLNGYGWGNLGDAVSDVHILPGMTTSISVVMGSVTFSATTVDGVITGQWVYLDTQKLDAAQRPVTGDQVGQNYIDNTGIATFMATAGDYVIQTDLPGWNWGSLTDKKGTANVHVTPGQVTAVSAGLGRIDVVAAQGTWVYVYLQQSDAHGNPVTGDQIGQQYAGDTERVDFDLTPGLYIVMAGDSTYADLKVTAQKTVDVP